MSRAWPFSVLVQAAFRPCWFSFSLLSPVLSFFSDCLFVGSTACFVMCFTFRVVFFSFSRDVWIYPLHFPHFLLSCFGVLVPPWFRPASHFFSGLGLSPLLGLCFIVRKAWFLVSVSALLRFCFLFSFFLYFPFLLLVLFIQPSLFCLRLSRLINCAKVFSVRLRSFCIPSLRRFRLVFPWCIFFFFFTKFFYLPQVSGVLALYHLANKDDLQSRSIWSLLCSCLAAS